MTFRCKHGTFYKKKRCDHSSNHSTWPCSLRSKSPKRIDIALILQHYEMKEKHFMFRQVMKKITIEDVNRILGLPMDEKSFNLDKKQKKGEHPLIDKKFSNCRQALKKTQVDKALNSEIRDNKRSSQHVASLIILSLLTSSLFSNSDSTIAWDLINATCNL